MQKEILPPVYLLIALLIMLLLHWFLPLMEQIIPQPWNWLGTIPLGLGIAANLIADAAFNRHGTTVKPFEESTVLITSGIFRISRNPMYLGMFVALTGAAIMFASLSPFFVIPVFCILIDRQYVQAEEKMLAATFGETWQQYQQKVRRWL